jgi:Fe-only nitrogenase accessory protein AnfO
MKIAVLVNENGRTVPYSAGGIIELYDLKGNSWQCIKAKSLTIDKATNISEVRERVHAVIKVIEDGKVFMVETIKSLPTGIFDAYGISVWNHQGAPMGAFDFVKEQEESKAKQKRSCCDKPSCKSTCSSNSGNSEETTSSISIEKMSVGYYKIDLARILRSNNSLNSKQLLIPFMKNTTFQKLEIICEHVPKWFEHELNGMNLQLMVEKSADGLCHAIVIPN